jgi:hypothetical protein
VKRIATIAVVALAVAAIVIPAASAKPVKAGPVGSEAASVTSEPWEGIVVAAGLGAVALAGGTLYVLRRRRSAPRVSAPILQA